MSAYPWWYGMDHICKSLRIMSFQTEGEAQEFFVIDSEKVLKLSKEIPLNHAAMIEPISVAVYALQRGG